MKTIKFLLGFLCLISPLKRLWLCWCVRSLTRVLQSFISHFPFQLVGSPSTGLDTLGFALRDYQSKYTLEMYVARVERRLRARLRKPAKKKKKTAHANVCARACSRTCMALPLVEDQDRPRIDYAVILVSMRDASSLVRDRFFCVCSLRFMASVLQRTTKQISLSLYNIY